MADLDSGPAASAPGDGALRRMIVGYGVGFNEVRSWRGISRERSVSLALFAKVEGKRAAMDGSRPIGRPFNARSVLLRIDRVSFFATVLTCLAAIYQSESDFSLMPTRWDRNSVKNSYVKSNSSLKKETRLDIFAIDYGCLFLAHFGLIGYHLGTSGFNDLSHDLSLTNRLSKAVECLRND